MKIINTLIGLVIALMILCALGYILTTALSVLIASIIVLAPLILIGLVVTGFLIILHRL